MDYLAYLKDLMHEHGLYDWSPRYLNRNTYRTYGNCRWYKKDIGINRDFCEQATIEEIRDLCLHEIAHALARIRYGEDGWNHGPLWQKVCVEIGADPTRLYNGSVKLKKTKYLENKYAMVFEGKVIRYYKKRSKKFARIKNMYLKGRKAETLGKLEIVAL